MSEALGAIDLLVGGQIRLARTMRGVSQKELAEAIGTIPQQIHKYETGRQRVKISLLEKIGTHLGLPIVFFFEESEQGKRVMEQDREAYAMMKAYLSLSSKLQDQIRRVIVTMSEEKTIAAR